MKAELLRFFRRFILQFFKSMLLEYKIKSGRAQRGRTE